MRFFLVYLKNELRLSIRNINDSYLLLFFFIISVLMFPFGISAKMSVLQSISVGIIMVYALFATVLSLPKIFNDDYLDATIETLISSNIDLNNYILAKIINNWIMTGLPFIIVTPLLALFLNMDFALLPIFLITMTVMTILLNVIGVIGASLILGAKNSGILISVLVLPLFIPILIFSVIIIQNYIQGISIKSSFLILGAMFFFFLPVSLILSNIGLRQSYR